MTPAARTQAAIELLEAIATAARDGGAAADVLIARYFTTRRYAGSKDRRAVRELVYDAIRLIGERPDSGRAAMLALLERRPDLAASFDGTSYGPAAIDPDEPVATAAAAPRWMEADLRTSGLDRSEVAALLERAPLDIRVNTLKTTADALLDDYPGAARLTFAPAALRLATDTAIERSAQWDDGLVAVQDAGSQAVALATQAAPGMTVVDLCAGAGGKTLAIAAMMENRGRIVASDADRTRLSRLMPRAERAGVTIAEARLLDPGREAAQLGDLDGTADVVLIDAPCSGTGTWRRNPEARWRLTRPRLQKLAETQAHLLDIGAPLVRSGGALVYVVCSLLDREGRTQVAAFLARHAGWRAEPVAIGVGRAHGDGLRLTPASDGTDGFFVARLIAP